MEYQLKVGDKVRWSGNYFHKYKDGMNKEKMLSNNNFSLSDYIEFKFKKGVGKIKSIEYHNEMGQVMIKLYNGKCFSLNDNSLKLIKSK